MSLDDLGITAENQDNTQETSDGRPKFRRRRGKRAGLRVWLRKRGHRPPLPTMMMGNVRSIRNKIDELAAQCRFNQEYCDTSLICLTETWLESKDADGTVQLDNFNLIRGDRVSSTKSQGGGVGIYINNRWCKNVTLQHAYCDTNVELLTISCRPFYLPREFNNVYITVAYIPPDGDYKKATETLTNCVQNMDKKCNEGVNILVGDFNNCDISSHIPNYYQFVNCTTRAEKMLDLVYCNIRNAYKVIKRAPLGNSDHNMLFCMPSYKQKLKTQNCKTVQIKQWSDESIDSLRACFDCTNWDTLLDDNTDIDTNVDVLTCYIQFCVDLLVPTKTIKMYPNNKPWVTKDVKFIINRKKATLSSNRSDIKTVQKELNEVIRDAKAVYKNKVEKLFSSKNTKDAWKGLKCLSGYINKQCLPDPENVNTYVNELNSFYARFDDMDFQQECNNILNMINKGAHERTVISINDVLQALNRAKPGKASGPDKVSARVIKSCRGELVMPIHKLFQTSLDLCYVPIAWKKSEVIPVPKVKIPVEKNDLRPVALTSVIMKCFEFIIKGMLGKQLSGTMDKLQFAYKQHRGVEDAVTTLLDIVCSHLDKPKTYCRVLFIDFSSAFNTIKPHIMLQKLQNMGINGNLIKWIYSYLTGRPQYVYFNNVSSTQITTNTGAPQGCVLSPLLFTLYTNDCCSAFQNCTIIKYADDTVIIGNIENNNETLYLNQVDCFVDWCNCNYLNLNVKKTMEMFIDFRKDKNQYCPLVIKAENVKIVDSYKYLGVIIDNKLTFAEHIQYLYKKSIQRIHHLRLLHNIRVDTKIMSLFYSSIVQTVLSFNIVTWFGSANKKDERKLCKIIRIARRMGVETKCLLDLYNQACDRMTVKIMNDLQHPLNNKYVYLRSGKRLCVPKHRTSRYGRTFVPSSIKLFNFMHK